MPSFEDDGVSLKIIVFLGAPGSGKGTQAKRLSFSGEFQHFSTGDMLRASIARKDPVGLQANQFISTGELVPDSVMIALIETALSRVASNSNVLLDGFPRTIPQAMALDSNPKTHVATAIYFLVPENALIERLTGRRICKACGEPFHIHLMPSKKNGICDRCNGELLQRADDRSEVVRKRLEVFTEQNVKLLEYYESSKRLIHFDGNRPADRIQSELGQLLH